MHLFRSEEHVRAWIDFDPDSADGIRTVAELLELFSLPLFRERLAPDYILRLRELVPAYREGLERLAKASPFWGEKPPS